MGDPICKQHWKVWALVEFCTVPKAEMPGWALIKFTFLSPHPLTWDDKEDGLRLHWAGVWVDPLVFNMLRSALKEAGKKVPHSLLSLLVTVGINMQSNKPLKRHDQIWASLILSNEDAIVICPRGRIVPAKSGVYSPPAYKGIRATQVISRECQYNQSIQSNFEQKFISPTRQHVDQGRKQGLLFFNYQFSQ